MASESEQEFGLWSSQAGLHPLLQEFLRWACFALSLVVVFCFVVVHDTANTILPWPSFINSVRALRLWWLQLERGRTLRFSLSSPLHSRHKGFLRHLGTTHSCPLTWHLFGSLASSLFLSQPILFSGAQLTVLNLTSDIALFQTENKVFLLASVIQNWTVHTLVFYQENYSCVPHMPIFPGLIIPHMMFPLPEILLCTFPLAPVRSPSVLQGSSIIYLFYEAPSLV